MPIPVQIIFATISPISLYKAAAVADRIFEINSNSFSVSFVTSVSENSSSVLNHHSATEPLCDKVKALRREVADLRRFRSIPRNARNGRTRSKSRSEKLSYYHFRFRENAKKCISPCFFQESS
ncbi:hypothetical protein NPIL_368101 [Nephila pilipes]|uniref:Uncharacterized protein n=1 Tax=Nephila pilipes TaxID=299642 RepID=A0A8X6QZT2_NEPPI|nr:hypothetical protein NPIL_368101 [Nephila pilipes]